MKSLPMDDAIFLEVLRKQDLFPGDLQEQVQAKITKAEKTAWFLDRAIKPALDVDIIEPLRTLLTVMSDGEIKSDLLGKLATTIQQQLDKETSLISSHGKDILLLQLFLKCTCTYVHISYRCVQQICIQLESKA